jgi:hypothetical protein
MYTVIKVVLVSIVLTSHLNEVSQYGEIGLYIASSFGFFILLMFGYALINWIIICIDQKKYQPSGFDDDDDKRSTTLSIWMGCIFAGMELISTLCYIADLSVKTSFEINTMPFAVWAVYIWSFMMSFSGIGILVGIVIYAIRTRRECGHCDCHSAAGIL